MSTLKPKNWTPLHVPNVWPEREKFRKIDQARQAKQNKLRGLPHNLTTGSATLVVTQIKLTDESASTDHVGTSITQSYTCQYTGAWSSLYITANASTIGLPWYGDYIAGATGYIYCSNSNVKLLGGASVMSATTANPGAFTYTATYSPITPDRLDLSPLSRPAVWSYGGSDLTEARKVDQDGTAVTNSTGDYCEGIPEFYVGGTEASVTFNVSSPHACTALSYTVNQNSFGGYDAGQGMIGKVDAEETFETYQGVFISFYRITIPQRYRTDENGWRFAPLDYGNRYLGADGIATNYVDPKTGAYGPVFLDGSGKLLGGDGTSNAADPVVYPTGGDHGDGYTMLKPSAWSGVPTPPT